MDKPITSVFRGTNSQLIEYVAPLWIDPFDTVMDLTYGLGNFWKCLPGQTIIKHDIALDGVDFRSLPYHDESFEGVMVLDPPYIAMGGRSNKDNPSIEKFKSA